MKKTFPLRPEGKHPDRVLDALKHELRKYMARERRRPLPEGMDFWDFDCRFGASPETAEAAHPGELNRLLDALAQGGATQCHVELLARPARRKWVPRPVGAAPEGGSGADHDAAAGVHPAQSPDAAHDAE